MIWKLSPSGTSFDSYLVGTMHANTHEAFSHISPILSCIDQCAAFAAEFPLDGDTSAGGNLLLPPGTTLRDYIAPRHYTHLQNALLRYLALDLDAFRQLLPLVVAQHIDALLVSGPERNYPPLDLYLWQYAGQRGKALLGIETQAEQHAILASIPISEQVRSLEHIGRNLRAHRRKLLALAHLYAMGDHDQLYRAARRSAGTMRKNLLLDRNAIMADRIASSARRQPTCFAIGAAHLGGGKGVLRFLKAKKVKWTKIT